VRKDCAEDAKEYRKQTGIHALKFVAACAINTWIMGGFHLTTAAFDINSLLEARVSRSLLVFIKEMAKAIILFTLQ
jgi:hypothetical protein